MKLKLLCVCVFLTQILTAQTFTEAPQRTLFEGAVLGSVAFADVDGDSDQDVLITGRNSSDIRISKLYINDGSGGFTEATDAPFEGVEESDVAFADVDGDSDQDVLITGLNSSENPTSTLYINDGSGSFTKDADTPFEGIAEGSIAFADVDGDSDQDVLITGLGISKLYANNGTGSYVEVLNTPFEGLYYSSIAFADVDGDGDQDVLITGSDISKLYINNGTGSFVEATDVYFEGLSSGSIAFTDVDGDSDQDVLITGSNISKLYINNGTGSFAEAAGTPFEGANVSSVAFADVDGDNDQDVLIAGFDTSFGLITKLYTNSGAGSYAEVLDTPFEALAFGDVAFADVDGDNDQDLLLTGVDFTTTRISKLYINNGEGFSNQNSVIEHRLELAAYPNPATSSTLCLKYHSTKVGTVTLNVYNVHGSLVMQQRKNTAIGEQILTIDVKYLTKGNYFVELMDGINSGVVKFVIE